MSAEVPNDQIKADFRFPGEMKFELLPPLEIRHGRFQEIEDTENGQPLRRSTLNNKNQVIYCEEYGYKNGAEPSPENLVSHRQTFFGHDQRGRVSSEFSQTFPDDPKHQDQQWRIEHRYGEGNYEHTILGHIETGADAGHKWQTIEGTAKDFGDGRRIVRTRTEILEQGLNPDKPEPGPISETIKYFDGKKWLGERTTNLKTGEVSEFLPDDQEALPNWEY